MFDWVFGVLTKSSEMTVFRPFSHFSMKTQKSNRTYRAKREFSSEKAVPNDPPRGGIPLQRPFLPLTPNIGESAETTKTTKSDGFGRFRGHLKKVPLDPESALFDHF